MHASFGLARDGSGTAAGGRCTPQDRGLLMQQTELYLPGPPVLAKKAALWAFDSTARLLGYGPGFARYADSAGVSGGGSVVRAVGAALPGAESEDSAPEGTAKQETSL